MEWVPGWCGVAVAGLPPSASGVCCAEFPGDGAPCYTKCVPFFTFQKFYPWRIFVPTQGGLPLPLDCTSSARFHLQFHSTCMN